MSVPDIFQTVITWATGISAFASLVNAGCVVVLARINHAYAQSTAKILEESQKARVAAQQQALAAQAQASVAQRSLELLHQQFEDQQGLGKSVVQTTIDSATSAVAYWKELDINNLNSYRIPPTDNLVPSNANAAVDHARRISTQGAEKLSSAFDDLRNAQNEIEGMKQGVKLTGQVAGMYASNCKRAERLFDSAWTKLLEAKALLP